ncbi:hypothetical protein CKM354_000329900 [Cercospora kikuchii]|uniref:Uncharacterized protein n=1 Tax=Cercospora kikuchii TaxID=84275 RepID=A0A9P3CEJ8_9PEZI|nr:uncharacterized protein CKM354_000329900 [Cercospora kikuchii]GIZ39937.1 hypothetical protein CKM354_000329900 [Cercospora kikuchii]
MSLTTMTPPTVIVSPAERPPTSRRAVALEHRKQNILTMKYRASAPNLKEMAAKQTSTVKNSNIVKPERKLDKQSVSHVSFRLQSADIDLWLKESMPLPPDEQFGHVHIPGVGLGIALVGEEEPGLDYPYVAPLRVRNSDNNHAGSQMHATPRTVAQTIQDLRLGDFEEQSEYRDYRASDPFRTSFSSSTSSELLNWPLVNR